MCIYQAQHHAFEDTDNFAWMLQYLTGIAADGCLPRRQDVDPVAMRHLISAVNLIDLVPDGDDFRLRYRLVGSLQGYFFASRQSPDGKFLDDYWGHDAKLMETMKSEYRRALETASPVVGNFRRPSLQSREMRFRRALYPLGSDGRTVDCFLSVHDYQQDDLDKGARELARNPTRQWSDQTDLPIVNDDTA